MTQISVPAEGLDFIGPDGEILARLQVGAVEGNQFGTLLLYRGDIINVRNMQFGTADDPNGDISAGGDGVSSGPRGNLNFQFDNGKGVGIWNGRKQQVATFNYNDSGVIRFYRDAFIANRDNAGRIIGWRKL